MFHPAAPLWPFSPPSAPAPDSFSDELTMPLGMLWPFPPPSAPAPPLDGFSDELTLPLTVGITAVAFCAEFVYGLASFGPAITYHIGFHVMHLLGLTRGTVADAMSALVVPECVMGLAQTALLHRGASAPLFFSGGFFLVCGLLLGLLLLEKIGTSVWLKRSVGLVLLLFAAERAHALASRGATRGANPELDSGTVCSTVAVRMSHRRGAPPSSDLRPLHSLQFNRPGSCRLAPCPT